MAAITENDDGTLPEATAGATGQILPGSTSSIKNEDKISKQETNMETHAHHLHHAPGKKFWHYFNEFIMLFFAVFSGFLAENFREHQVEKEKGDQFIRSFYDDLKQDTGKLASIINLELQKADALGNMFTCYDTIQKNWTSSACLWELVKNSNYNKPFQQTDRTLRQLANSGGFRLLQREDADSITRYEIDKKGLEDFQSTIYQQAQDNVRNTLNTLVDFKSFSQLRATLSSDTNKFVPAIPLLLSDDKVSLNKYFNQLLMYLKVTKGHCNQMERFKNKATTLILYFKNKYRFE